jgi:hypothetical protein
MSCRLRAVVVLSLWLSLWCLPACKGKEADKAPAVVPKDPRLARILTLADATCACADLPCADKTTKEIFDIMGTALGATGDHAEAKAVQDAIKRAAACKAKLKPTN